MADHVDEKLAHEIAALLENGESPEQVWGTLLVSGFEPNDIARTLDAVTGNSSDDDEALPATTSLRSPFHQQEILLGRLAIEAGTATSASNPQVVGADLQHSLGEVRLGVFAGDPTTAVDLATMLSRIGFSGVQVYASPHDLHDEQWVDREIEAMSAEFVIACTTGTDRTLSQQVNAASLAANVPSLHLHLHGVQLIVGPLVIPRETACFQCFTIRREAALAPWERALLQMPGETGALAWPLGLDWLAIDLIKHVLKIGEPASRGRVLTIDYLSGVPEMHTLLRVPNCPACGPPQRPAVRIWDDPA